MHLVVTIIMVKGMANIVMKNRLGLIFCLFVLVLSGCSNQSHIVITEENALEVALDEAGYKEDQVDSIVVERSNSTFDILFNVDAGQYHVVVNDRGMVDSFTFDKNVESKKEEVVPETIGFDSQPMVEGGLSTEELAKRVATHLGFHEYDAKDFSFELNPERTQVTVRVKVANSGDSIVVMDVFSGAVYSTLVNQ